MADSSDPGPIFRAAKRRKIFRSRTDEADNDIANLSTTTTHEEQPDTIPSNALAPTEDDTNDDAAVIDLLRQRRLLKVRRGGIAFNQEQSRLLEKQGISQELMLPEAPSASSSAISRFAAETGQRVVSNDNVMTAYIDSEIAKARADQSPTILSDQATLANDGNPPGVIQRHPAAVGKLAEVDLGQETALKNEARTRRMLGGLPEEEEAKVQKVRLGRDGKPRRKRWRRPSEDLKRDALVDAVMKESKLDVYDTPEQAIATGNDEAADDVVAERFRQEYMEAAQQRLQMQRKPATTAVVRGKVADPARGPKLGGSRSTRAAYHAQEKAAAAGKK